MAERITAEQFLAADGIEDWQVLPSGEAAAYFATGNFAAGVALVDEIGRLAEAANHHPDVDLRYKSVTVRVISHDIGALSQRDVKLARAISAAAQALGAPADPGAL
jgi:4a-hydroxytetrahydrobiopterin dehydratase